jgi:hypothetical protein
MRRTLLILALAVAAAVAACGARAAGSTPIVFGTTGGNLIGYQVTIESGGTVHLRGPRWRFRRHIRPARVRELRREIRHAKLASSICANSLPDFATRFIRLGDRRFAVRGECEAAFNRVFGDLEKAVALRPRG